MSLPRYAARRDANEPALILAARKLGWWMIQMDTPCDWFGCFRGRWFPVEIKMPDGDLTDAQQKFVTEADHRHAPVIIWRTLDDVAMSSV